MKTTETARAKPPLWLALILAGLAGGMAWGIRGQYGHETGAMIAGLLVSLVLVFLFCPTASSLPVARAVAWCTVAISFGGSMTYGQTVGLTHDTSMIGNAAAFRWGMFGLMIKGGIWIGFAGAFLGMGLSGKSYHPRELLLLLGAMIGLLFVGVYLFNEPFDPDQRLLPKLYFSDHWHWEPDADLQPRRERWGGLLLALIGLVGYVTLAKRDRLARNLAFWGFLGGALGFPLGQSLQALHAWYPEWFRQGWFALIEPHINWWNMMETVFGIVFGIVLALGLWLHRSRIDDLDEVPVVEFKPRTEWILVAVHVPILMSWNFVSLSVVDAIADLALTMGVIPIVAIAGGRYWPYLLALPITLLPIAGKTVRDLCYRDDQLPLLLGWVVYLALPIAIATIAAIWFAQRARAGQPGRTFARWTMLIATWLYFGLNFAFFNYPWPWTEWTYRTPNVILFTVSAVGLTLAALTFGIGQSVPARGSPRSSES